MWVWAHECCGSHGHQVPLELELQSCELPNVGTENSTRVLCKSRASLTTDTFLRPRLFNSYEP